MTSQVDTCPDMIIVARMSNSNNQQSSVDLSYSNQATRHLNNLIEEVLENWVMDIAI